MMNAAPPTTSPGRRWIDRRIESLDPDSDFVEIMRLTMLYRVNDLQLHWFYAVGTPAAGISPAVIDAVWRDGSGTYNVDPDRRRDDSVDHLMTWVEHGPGDAVTNASVEMVNRYHAHFARTHPQGFATAEDYVYILCLNATLFHRATRSLGLAGLSAKQQRAAWLFWSRLADRFVMGTTGETVTALASFPPTFHAMVQLVEDYIDRPWPTHRPGHESTSRAIDHFARTWFPRPLHPFGRALVTAFLPAGLRRAHAIDPPPRILAVAGRAFMWAGIVVSTHLAADPPDSILDRRRRSSAAPVAGGVDGAVHRKAGRGDTSLMAAGGCPHRVVPPAFDVP